MAKIYGIASVMAIPPLSAKDDTMAPRQSSSRASFESFMSEGGEDIFMTIETHDGSEFVAIEHPRTTFDRKGSLQKEKQISVDPKSLNAPPLPSIRQASFRLVSSPSSAPKSDNLSQIPHPQPPPKLKFVSASLPGSASTSPKSNSSLLKKIWRNENEISPGLRGNHVSRIRSTMDDSQLALKESNMRRSKSVREGRLSTPPTDDFELWLEKPGERNQEYNKNHSFGSNYRGTEHHFGSEKNGSSRQTTRKNSRNQFPPEDKFKCGKLCLFLPRSGKGKPARSTSSTSTASVVSAISAATSAGYSTASSTGYSSAVSSQTTQDKPTISRTVSLEKFKCGSWSTAGLLNDYDEEDGANLFFDLPSEMIRCSVSDMQSPVTAAFLFDKDAKSSTVKEPTKGVLKNSSSTASSADGVDGRKSKSSSQDNNVRHVRFSTTSPTSSPRCITPRLRKARDEFNAFLEAQNAFV